MSSYHAHLKSSHTILTIAMPVFNGGKQLPQAVQSVLCQTFSQWVLLLIDDGSTDGALLEITEIQDNRIHILCDGINKGLAVRLNEAIGLTMTPFFARMDSDDVAYAERFEKQVILLEQDTELDLVATRAATVSNANILMGELPYALTHNAICARPWIGFHMAHPTWVGRSEWFQKHRYAVPSPYCCEDQELLLRTYSTSKFGMVDEVLLAYRLRDKMPWKKQHKTRWALFRVQARHFFLTSQWLYLLLTAFALTMRLLGDIVTFSLQQFGVRKPVLINETEVRKWSAVCRLTLENRPR